MPKLENVLCLMTYFIASIVFLFFSFPVEHCSHGNTLGSTEFREMKNFQRRQSYLDKRKKVVNHEGWEGDVDLIAAVCFMLGIEGKAWCLLNLCFTPEILQPRLCILSRIPRLFTCILKLRDTDQVFPNSES